MADDYRGTIDGEVATLKEKVRALEEAENSIVRRFIGKVEKTDADLKTLRDSHVELEHTVQGHIKWSGQIPINYERLHLKVEGLETAVREGFADLSQKVKGQDRDFDYFVRIPAKTVLIGILGVFGLTFGNSIIRMSHAVWTWFDNATSIRFPK